MVKKKSRKIVVLGTGGTIAGQATDARDNVGYSAAQVAVSHLLDGVGVDPDVQLVPEQLAQVDSKDMDFGIWQLLARRCMVLLRDPDVSAIVITHGTDTMEETAYFLHTVLALAAVSKKPVVLTGAMRPASSLSPDGPGNLRDALQVATDAAAQGVLVVFAGVVHHAADVRKVHPYRLDAFSSGEAGPAGFVEERVVRWSHPQASRPVVLLPAGAVGAAGKIVARINQRGPMPWPRVEIILSYAGAGAAMVDALVASAGVPQDQALRGIVVAGTGNASLHKDLEATLCRAQAAGIAVVRSTRCCEGRTVAGAPAVLPDAAGLDPVKARIALMLGLLGLGKDEPRRTTVTPYVSQIRGAERTASAGLSSTRRRMPAHGSRRPHRCR